MFKMTELVEAFNELIVPPDGLHAAKLLLDARTVRYYSTMEILADPEKIGRDTYFTKEHLITLLAAKTLQQRGYELGQIRTLMRTTSIDSILANTHISQDKIDSVLGKLKDRLPDDKKAGVVTQIYFAMMMPTDRIRISSSVDPMKRIQELKLSMLGLMPGGRELEVKLHEKFSDEKLTGEWFRLSERIKNYINENCTEIATATLAALEQKPSNTEKARMSKIKRVNAGPDKIEIRVTDPAQFHQIQGKLRLGSRFVFLSDLDEAPAKKLHRLIFGQKGKQGEVKNAVIPALPDEFELPGCQVTGPAPKSDLSIIVSDKDVYKEGVDVAQLFIFDPAGAGQKKKILVNLDGALLEAIDTTLDNHGCGVVSFATMFVGSYEAVVDGSSARRKFETTRYTLAPLAATLAKIAQVTVDGKTKINVAVEAASFGQPFAGPAQVSVLSRSQAIHSETISFHEGLATVSFEPAGDEALSIMVQSKADAELIANVPVPGSRRSEREDTCLSDLGKIQCVSLIPSNDSKCERGLYISEKGISNTPISITSVVAREILLMVNAPVTSMTVVVHEPVTGETSVHELGNVKKGKKKLSFGSAMAQVHIGAFVEGKPWEGHAVVVRPSDASVSLRAPSKLTPGEYLSVRIKTNSDATVLLRIADSRMRVQDSPMTAAAATIKRWIASEMSKGKTGEANLLYVPGIQNVVPAASWQNARVGGTQPRYLMQHSPLRGGTVRGLSGTIGAARQTQDFEPDNMYRAKSTDVFMQANSNMDDGSMPMMAVPDISAEKIYFAASAPSSLELSSASLMADVAEIQTAKAPLPEKPKTKPIAREMDVDLVYSGLIRVKKDATVRIKLPDTIGQYDITAFSVSGMNWTEASTSVQVDKSCYIEPMIPQFAHPEDNVQAVAIGVRGPKTKKYSVKIDGVPATSIAEQEGDNVRLSWAAKPGIHEVVMFDDDDQEIDRIQRIVEAPGEEAVMTQELKLLKAGESYDISDDDGALSVRMLPGLQQELKVAVQICTDFSHSCCEQTSAKIMAACVAAVTGDSDSEKENAYQSIIRGEARLRSMYREGKGFLSYPGSSINQSWSTLTAHRISNLSLVAGEKLPDHASKAVASLISMGKDVLSSTKDAHSMLPMESAYYRDNRKVTGDEINTVLARLADASVWDYSAKTEAAYCAAVLARAGRLDETIKAVNAVSKAMGGTMGGAMHGTCECLAYLLMVLELRKAGIVPGTGGKAAVNGKEMEVLKAIEKQDISTVKAGKSACALRITRLSKIRFDEMHAGVQMKVSVTGKTGKTFRAGEKVVLNVQIQDYADGDVICVALPECLSRIVAGTKSRKFQVDFAGKKELEIELVAGRKTSGTQRWAAVVRNMYDGSRIGSVGLLNAEVK